MEDLTLILIVASFLAAGGAFILKKTPRKMWILTLTLSICGIGAVIWDPAFSSDNNGFLLCLVPLSIIFIYSAYNYSFGGAD